MSKIHMVDRYTNEILEYEKETDIEFNRIVEYKECEDIDERPDDPLITVKLDNGVVVKYFNDDCDAYFGERMSVYAPVYKVSEEEEEYSLYEKDDLIGFIKRDYEIY